MQNKYIGDPGDFAKFLLLKSLVKSDEILGINWYMVDDNDNTDGNKIPNDVLINIDKDLFDKLAALRSIKPAKPVYPDLIGEIERAGLLSSIRTVKYNAAFLHHTGREQWFKNSLINLKGCNFIFCDPDNGIESLSSDKIAEF